MEKKIKQIIITTISREEGIDALIEEDMNTWAPASQILEDTLRQGFKGYNNYSDEEMQEQLTEQWYAKTETMEPEDIAKTPFLLVVGQQIPKHLFD